MAKKTKQAVAPEATGVSDLDKTILINGTPYNVNAVTADKVANALNINSSNSDESGTFDGSAPKTINVMSRSGGDFTGPITVPSHTPPTYKFTDTDVLNFTETINVLLDNIKNNAVVYNWKNDGENKELKASLADNAINSISIVSGGELDVDDFHAFNNESYQQHLKYLQYLEASASGATSEELKDAFYLPVYLYIGTTDNLVYCGVAGTEKANLLNINTASVVEQAKKLTTARKITVDLSKDARDGKAFDGDNDVIVGVTGQLSIDKVAIDETTAKDARNRLGITLENVGAAPTDHEHSASDIIDGILDPARGGTGKDKLADVTVGAATKAEQDSTGTPIRENYYRYTTSTRTTDELGPRVTISPSDPTSIKKGNHGANGDIWIKYLD